MVNAKQLMAEAESLEASAKDALPAWTILGQSSKYDEHMAKAAKLRRAAVLKPTARREFMQNNGLT